MSINLAHVDITRLGELTRDLVVIHMENPEHYTAEFILSVLVNECFKQEIKKIRG